MNNFSVLMPISYQEKAIFLSEALGSIIENQTVKPTEVVLVKDGIFPSSLEKIITSYKNEYPTLFKIINFSKNKGIGEALKIGVENCSNELIARMDSDDVAHPKRFEKQLNFLKKHPKVDVVGGIIKDFKYVVGDLQQYRVVPEYHKDIIAFAKYRCPINHPTAMYRKYKVLAAGNYNKDFSNMEDYALWMAMLQNGAKFHNLQETLLYFRFGSGKEIVKRRSGLSYLKISIRLKKYIYKLGFYTLIEYWLYSLCSIIARFILPSFFLLIFYTSFYRNKKIN